MQMNISFYWSNRLRSDSMKPITPLTSRERMNRSKSFSGCLTIWLLGNRRPFTALAPQKRTHELCTTLCLPATVQLGTRMTDDDQSGAAKHGRPWPMAGERLAMVAVVLAAESTAPTSPAVSGGSVHAGSVGCTVIVERSCAQRLFTVSATGARRLTRAGVWGSSPAFHRRPGPRCRASPPAQRNGPARRCWPGPGLRAPAGWVGTRRISL
jgi:hypothetical protein